MALSLDQSLAVSEDALFRELAGEGVILDLASGRYYGVDRVGARIFELLNTGASLRQVHRTLLDEFDVGPEVLERDLLEFATELVTRRLALAR